MLSDCNNRARASARGPGIVHGFGVAFLSNPSIFFSGVSVAFSRQALGVGETDAIANGSWRVSVSPCASAPRWCNSLPATYLTELSLRAPADPHSKQQKTLIRRITTSVNRLNEVLCSINAEIAGLEKYHANISYTSAIWAGTQRNLSYALDANMSQDNIAEQ